MNRVQPTRLLRTALIIDAVASGATGLLQTAASGFVSTLLGLPAELLLGTGVFMLAYAATLAVMARSAPLPRSALRVVIYGNGGWALGCVALAAMYAPLTALGVGYLLLQAAAVAAFAAIQAIALARSVPVAVPAPQRA